MINCRYCKQDKPRADFYKSAIRSNGTGDCKECVRARVRANRAKKIEYYRDFDRQRGNLPHRVQARRDYAQTDQGKVARARAGKMYAKRYPHRAKATNAVNNAIRDGKLYKPSECENCGHAGSIEGHHCDYNKPLDVMWLCTDCHIEWHKENTPIYHVDEVKSPLITEVAG